MTSDGRVELLDRIPVTLDVAKVMSRIQMRSDPKRVEAKVRELLEVVTPVMRPKAVYRECRVSAKDSRTVDIGGVTFSSYVLCKNLEGTEKVFPFIATCGTEVDAIKIPVSDMMKLYCLDVIKMALAISATMYLREHLTQRFGVSQLSSMNPGELASWPITQQRPLFSVLGDVEGMIGVRLTNSFMMAPLKSRSGIYWSSETKFESCHLCLQQACTARRARYDAELAEQYRDPSDAQPAPGS